MARTKTRISVPLSPEIMAQVLAEAQKIGVSAPTHLAHLIGTHYATTNTIITGLNETLRKGIENAKQIGTDE